MNDLDFFYQTPLKNFKFINRKVFITSAKTIISGCIGSGKTSLISEYLNKFKQNDRLYINLTDTRIDKNQVLKNLQAFITKNNIKVLAIENISQNDIANLTSCFKHCEKIVFSTYDTNLKIDGFSNLKLNYLDYEEFISFFKKNIDQSMLFSHFLAHGGAVKSAFLDPTENSEFLQNELKRGLEHQKIELLKECAFQISSELNSFEIYKNIKAKTKVSKDSVYNKIYELEQNGFIINIGKFNESKAKKRVFFSNFALKNSLILKKDFNSVFKNAVFCELLKLKTDIFYTKEFDFYLPNRKIAILCVPFGISEIVFLKFQKLRSILKELNISKLQVISVSNYDEVSQEGIRCEITPFYQWALGF
ncbi:AAA family ATPase [Campylobacter pinnipediorum subsp. caledonicus]|uniref:ATP-binding protein n=1 Tax=Campylobacter pinnipediorum TaxID=1965231 RepID=UPI0009952519|nr:ATP-binding protein [Campylobacter pinnipediorum]OPA71940.1 AAA family ATPase [Campylobacter pinnipediorum subsp. caledonicus]